MRLIALTVLVAAALWRALAVYSPELGNFAPVMALAFCGGVYFRSWPMWLAPFLALGVSDVFLNRYYAAEFHYAYSFPLAETGVRVLCFAAGLGLGRLASRQRSWRSLLGGILGASTFFYLATNTMSWIADAGYAHGLAGWWQAITVGHPQFAPTLYFFRNTFASDLLFTAGFALAMEYVALRRGEPSLLRVARQRA